MACNTNVATSVAETDPHTLLVEASAQLNGIRNLTVESGDEHLIHLTGFELDMMLKPITERIASALTSLEGVQQ